MLAVARSLCGRGCRQLAQKLGDVFPVSVNTIMCVVLSLYVCCIFSEPCPHVYHLKSRGGRADLNWLPSCLLSTDGCHVCIEYSGTGSCGVAWHLRLKITHVVSPVLLQYSSTGMQVKPMRQALGDMRVVSCGLQTSGYIPGQIRLICHLY